MKREVPRAFTLVELMVVIGIIAILIALLLPTLTRVREAGNAVKCAAQLRAIGQAIIGYTATHGGLLPAWSGNHSYPDDIKPDDPLGPGWIVLIEPNSGAKPDSPLYTCPSYRGGDRSITYFLEARYTGGRVPDDSSMPIARISRSAQFVLSGDVTNIYWYRPPFGDWDRDFDNTDKDDNLQRCVAFFGEAGGMNMHRAGNNLLFADGHVAIFRKFDPQGITYHPTELRNWDEVERQN
jgi:prepilin-type N-terminal cleavage/methylation domain-containing protein/prepilin-type processing-associated H-X9-DG protein